MSGPLRVVFVGGGHATLEATRRLAGEQRVRATVVSESDRTIYSGSVPAELAGLVPRGTSEIVLPEPLANRGIAFVRGEAVRVDPGGAGVTLADGRRLACDAAVVDVGSATALPAGIGPGGAVVPVRPMRTFLERLRTAVAACGDTRSPPRIAVVGGGAAAVELALCLRHAGVFRGIRDGLRPEISLLTRGGLLEEFDARFARLVAGRLDRLGVEVVTGAEVLGAGAGTLRLADGRSFAADVSVWATGPAARVRPEVVGGRRDEAGFLAIGSDLRVVGRDDVFAAGDCASFARPVAKSGVHAVRQGPLVAENLLRLASGRPLRPYRPRRGTLSLVAVGDGTAVGSLGPLSFGGAWVWRWKRWLDGRFVERHRVVKDRRRSR